MDIFQQGAFQSTGNETPEQLAKRRAMLESGYNGYGRATNIGQGIGDLFRGIGEGYHGYKLNEAERAANERRASANAAIESGLMGAGTPQAPAQIPAIGSGVAEAPGVPLMAGNVSQPFLDTLRSGGITNPNALAAVGATGQRESGWNAARANASWADPSERGVAGTSGGTLSWRDERLNNLRKFAASQGEQGNGSPATQAKFFMQEDPALVERLNAAKSPEEAMQHMNNAWRFAGYNRPGGEAAARIEEARRWAGRFGAGAQAPQSQQAPQAAVQQAQDPSRAMPDPVQPVDPSRAISDAPARPIPFGATRPVTRAPIPAPPQMAQAPIAAPQITPQVTTPQARMPFANMTTGELGKMAISGMASPEHRAMVAKEYNRRLEIASRDPNDARMKAAQAAEAEARLADRPMATQKSQLEIAKMQREANAVDMDVREDPATGALIERRKGTNEPWTPVQGAGPKRATPTTDQTELSQINQERASQGLPSLRMDEWKLQKGKASAPAVNIDQKQESEFGKETGKALAKRFDQLATDGDEASQNQVLVDEMRRLGGKIKTGGSAAFTKRLGDIGIKLDGVSDIEAYSALIDRMTPAQRLPGSGATSDFDAKMFKGSLPNLMNTPVGNQIITDTMEKLNANKMARGDIAMRVQAGELKPNEGLAEIRKLQAEARGLSDSVKDFAKPKEGGTPSASTTQSQTPGKTKSGVTWSVE